MTIAAGFSFDGGVLLCSDSQFTATPLKIDGVKLDVAEPQWGKVMMTFSGNGEFAPAAYYSCLEDCWNEGPRGIMRKFANLLEKFYRKHVFDHPLYEDNPSDIGYDFIIATRVKGDDMSRLFVTNDTVIRPVRSFVTIGSGSAAALPLLGLLYKPASTETYAVAVAAHVLHFVKRYADGCGGESKICVLRNNGHVEEYTGTRLVAHTEQITNFAFTEALRTIVGHTEGTPESFTERLQAVCEMALKYRDWWDNPQDWSNPPVASPTKQPNPESTKGDHSPPQPSPESPEGIDES